jgi:hypothetical protein
MTAIAAAPAALTPSRRDPRTPEGRTRAAMNALRHGLRAQRFLLLPEEDPAEFAGFTESVRAAYAPEDPTERHLVEGIAVAMWRELRADRLEAETLADIPPAEEGRGCGSDLIGRPEHRAGIATVLRYRSQAQLELRRALGLLLAHRRAKEQRCPPAEEDNEICTNELPSEDPPPLPPRVALRTAARRRRDPLDDPLLRRLGRDPDQVLPVPPLHPGLWPWMQRQASPDPAGWQGLRPYRRIPDLPPEDWHRCQAPASPPTPA